jgi:hypothetical protein
MRTRVDSFCSTFFVAIALKLPFHDLASFDALFILSRNDRSGEKRSPELGSPKIT